jgi:hypothetical protein
MTCLKKTILILQNCYLRSSFFVLFTRATENVLSHLNFGGWIWNVQMHTKIFFLFFLIFLNAFKIYFYNKCICSYETKDNVQRLHRSHHAVLERKQAWADVEDIRNIPLCTKIQSDFQAWHFEKSGNFSVRSAYQMLDNEEDERMSQKKKWKKIGWIEQTSASNSSNNDRMWTKLWKFQVPSKIRASPAVGVLIRLQRIHNFWCSMLIFTLFA